MRAGVLPTCSTACCSNLKDLGDDRPELQPLVAAVNADTDLEKVGEGLHDLHHWVGVPNKWRGINSIAEYIAAVAKVYRDAALENAA